MKIKLIPSLLALLVSGLIAFAFNLAKADTGITLYTAATAAIMLVSCIGCSIADSSRKTILFRTVCGVLFAVSVPMNIVLAITKTGIMWVTLANLIIVTAWLATVYVAVSGE